MKILICNKFNFLAGGTERYLFDLKKILKKNGNKIITFASQNNRNQPSPYSKYFVSQKDFNSSGQKGIIYNLKLSLDLIYSFSAKRKIARLIDDVRPDLAHIHNIYHHLSSSILCLLKKKKIPTVMTIHDYKIICPNYSLFTNNQYCQKCRRHKYFNAVRYRCIKNSYLKSFLACLEMYFCKITKIYTKNIDLFIAPSRFVKKRLIDFGIKKDKITYLPHAINLKKFDSRYSKGHYILYFGNLTHKKGVQVLLKAAQYIPTTAVKIAGSGPYQQNLKNLVKTYRLKNVGFLGYKKNNELAGIVKNAYLVIIPSLWPEASSLVAYEASKASKPILASKIGALPEIITDNKTGILFSPGNHRELAEKIKYLLANPEIAKKIGQNAKEKIDTFNNENSHYQKIIKIYRQLIKNELPLAK
jgi:glycosyltransferase involved in cell wall biosynthesis